MVEMCASSAFLQFRCVITSDSLRVLSRSPVSKGISALSQQIDAHEVIVLPKSLLTIEGMIYDDAYYAELAEQDRATKSAGKALFAFLKDAPQDLWLDMVDQLNFDQHDWIAHWMLMQPECDRSVAITLFHAASGPYFLKEKLPLPDVPQVHELHAVILQNWENGSYRTAEISLDQAEGSSTYRADAQRLQNAIDSVTDPVFEVPAEFLDLKGVRALLVPANLAPNEVLKVWKIYAPLDLRVHHLPPGPEREAYELKQKAHFARNRQFHPIKDLSAAVNCMGQRKHFPDKEAFGDWFNIYLDDKEHGASLLETAKGQQQGEPTLHFTDTNAFYLLLFFFFCAVFAVWEYVN